MRTNVMYVGLDVHKNSIDVAIAEAGGEIRHYGNLTGELKDLEKADPQSFAVRDPSFTLPMRLDPAATRSTVFSMIKAIRALWLPRLFLPRRPGDRIKCDRRDAMSLARLLRAGELTAVRVPDPDDEAMRDLVRAREDAKSVERRAKQRTAAFLLRHGHRYPGKTTWGRSYWRWLRERAMPHPGPSRSSSRNTWPRCRKPRPGSSGSWPRSVNFCPNGAGNR